MNYSLKKGFTLIELLIVVAVIGILASVILVGLSGFRQAGRDSRRIQDLARMRNALELYFNRCRFYPGTPACAANSFAATAVAGPPPGQASWTELTADLTGSGLGLDQVPNDPLIGSRSYTYARSANGLHYFMAANLEDPNNSALRDSYHGDPTVAPYSIGGSVPAATCVLASNPTYYCVVF